MGSDPSSHLIGRASRIELDAPLLFVADDLRVRGQCKNVSTSGILAEFEEPLDVWLKGRITVSTGEWHLSVRVRVVRIEGKLVGMNFQLDTDEDRSAIEKLVEVAQLQSAALTPGKTTPRAS